VVKRRVVILSAVALEARAIALAWGLKCPEPGRPARSTGHAPIIEIHLIGIRARQLPGEPGEAPVAAIIMAGLAGALDPALEIGDLVIDDCPADFIPPISHRVGRIVCSDALVTTPADKQRLRDETGALAVDMESAAARALAQAMKVPFIHIRGISDTAAESLDPAIMHLVDGFGRPRPMSVAGTLLRRPRLVPQLAQLGRNAKIAAANLAAGVAAMVKQIGE
jgi:hypothetical protein